MRYSSLSEPENGTNKTFFSELISNYNQSFLSEQFRGDMEENMGQINQKSIIIVKDLFQTIQKMLA